jgi:hemin uptake protein HemP
MTENQDQSEHEPPVGRPADRPRVIDADDLFQGTREIWLELAGVRYRLRITRRNKLILQK